MGTKASHLVILIFIVGCFGLYIQKNDGLKNRNAVSKYNINLEELKRTSQKEDSCLTFLDLPESHFDYCRISKIGDKGVVAVIGDSHAHVAFPGIADGLEQLGMTTVLIANS